MRSCRVAKIASRKPKIGPEIEPKVAFRKLKSRLDHGPLTAGVHSAHGLIRG